MSWEKPVFEDLFKRSTISRPSEVRIVLKGQYEKAYELLEDSVNAGLNPIIVGPPGIGKSLLAKKFVCDTNQPLHEVFFDDLMSPFHLIGTFNPALLVKKGYCLESFEPGPLLFAMLEGGVFLAHEINRATEFCQNSLLEPLEERTLYVPKLGRIKAADSFTFMSVANPYELAGTHKLSETLRDRLHVWVPLTYPEKEVELEIVRLNCPECELDSSLLEKIYSLISSCRESKEIVPAASIRATISIARIAARYAEMNKFNDEALIDIATHVLLGSTYSKPGGLSENKLRGILANALKIEEIRVKRIVERSSNLE